MKGIFKKMKGRVGKKGSSLIAVMTAMAVLSIVALCAAGIAITNYRTTQTYVSQDNYYYSAEAGQAQFVSNMTDVAYNIASNASWSGDNAYSNFYHQIKDAADEFQVQIGETLYNGEYKVNNEIILPEGGVFPNEKKYEFTIKTTVTNENDGTTQEFYSKVTVETPTSSGDQILTDTYGIFNAGYSLVSNGSAKNTDWYGLWGGFNTYYTQKVARTSPVNSSNYLGKIFTSEPETATDKTYYTSAIHHQLGTNENIAKNPANYSYVKKFKSSSNGSKFNQSNVASRVDGLKVDVNTLINSAVDAPGVQNIAQNTNGLSMKTSGTTKTITLNSALKNTSGYNKYYSADEKYYYKHNGNVELNFGATTGTTRFTGLAKGEFYRVICNSSGTSHGLAYQLDTNKNGTVDTKYTSSWGTNYTYFDHYYQNKFFFFDLGGTGTLKINNRTKIYDSNKVNSIFGYINTMTNYVKDAWDNYNGVADGNIVLEDCYFFVNGNIEVGNAFNFSNCKVFATGNITLGSVYYLEGLLSSETEAGSDIIKQSLYYCDGLFESKVISRYGMEWALKVNGAAYENLSGGGLIFSSWQIQCLLDTGNTYKDSITIFVGFLPVTTTYEGFLATYRYPTVIKAVIIAKGSETIRTSAKHTTNGRVSTANITVNDVSVYLNPNGTTTGVVDTVLIEGQIYAKGKIMVANYNDYVTNSSGVQANRYAASCQLQYQDYQGGISFEEIDDSIIEEIYGSTPVIIQNSGIFKN